MARKHILIVAATIGLAAVLAVVALGRTLGLASAETRAGDAAISERARQLERLQRSLERELDRSSAKTGADRWERVVYVRPKPIVVQAPRRHEDDGYERDEREGYEDDD